MLLSITASSQKHQLKRYDLKTGIVKYSKTTEGGLLGTTISGSGVQSLYFVDWGAVEMQEDEFSQITETSILGMKNSDKTEIHTMALLDNGEVHSVDFDNKVIHVRRDMAMDYMTQTDTHAGHAGKDMLEAMGGEKTGTEDYLGYKCELWTIPGGKQLIYKGVVLFLDMKVMGIRTILEATTAQFDISVPDKYFELPDYKVLKQSGYMNNETYGEEQEDRKRQLEQLSNMSYSEWKNKVKNDEDMKGLSDKELHQAYEMIQKMAKMMSH